jgi:hypothetical protein
MGVIVVGGVEEKIPKRELAVLIHPLRQVVEQRGIYSRTDRPDDRGQWISFADTRLDPIEHRLAVAFG